jgi:HlyD family secretion protein
MKAAFLFLTFIAAGGAFAFWVAGAMPSFGEKPVAQPATSKPIAAPSAIYGIGYVEPASDIRKLTFKIDGVIEKCPVHIGQQVAAGAVLATLRNNDEQSAIAVTEKQLLLAKAVRDRLVSGVHPAELEAAQRRIAALEVRLKFFQQQYNREMSLVKQKVSTDEALEQVTTDMNQTTEELKEAHAKLKHLETFIRAEDRAEADAQVNLAAANLAAAKTRFDDTFLRAPIKGTVLEILKREGEAVRAFDPTPVMVFADLSNLRVRAEFDERFVNSIREGQPAVLFGRGLGDRTASGKVTLVKSMMGKKTVFSRESSERKDLEVLQVFIEPNQPLNVPVGLKIDVELPALESDQKAAAEVAKSST